MAGAGLLAQGGVVEYGTVSPPRASIRAGKKEVGYSCYETKSLLKDKTYPPCCRTGFVFHGN